MLVKRIVRALIGVILGGVLLVLLLPAISKAVFFDLPGSSPEFDCDDSALFMYERFKDLGIKATPILGNLKTTGEKYEQITHVWVLVEIAGTGIAFDWGSPWLDQQHYEGYEINHEQLLMFVRQDQVDVASPPAQ